MTDCAHAWAEISPSGSFDEREFVCGHCQARRIDGKYPEGIPKAQPQIELLPVCVPPEHTVEAAPAPSIREEPPETSPMAWRAEAPMTPGWYWLRLTPREPTLVHLVFGSNRAGMKGKRPPNTTLRIHHGPEEWMNNVVEAILGQWTGPLEPPV